MIEQQLIQEEREKAGALIVWPANVLQLHKENLERERAKAPLTLERFRYRAYERSGVLSWRLMQRLGDFGRKHFWDPTIARAASMRIWW